jgi:hypothetical protein
VDERGVKHTNERIDEATHIEIDGCARPAALGICGAPRASLVASWLTHRTSSIELDVADGAAGVAVNDPALKPRREAHQPHNSGSIAEDQPT